MDPEFGLMDNLMNNMMGKISIIIKLSKVDPETPDLTEATTRP